MTEMETNCILISTATFIFTQAWAFEKVQYFLTPAGLTFYEHSYNFFYYEMSQLQ